MEPRKSDYSFRCRGCNAQQPPGTMVVYWTKQDASGAPCRHDKGDTRCRCTWTKWHCNAPQPANPPGTPTADVAGAIACPHCNRTFKLAVLP